MQAPATKRPRTGYAKAGGAPSRAASHTSTRIDAPLLNARISKAASADDILALHEAHADHFDAWHAGNAYHKLGRHVRAVAPPDAARWRVTNAPRITALAATAHGRLTECGPQQLANIAQGAAHAGIFDARLAAAIARRADAATLARCTPQHLANLSWAFATARVADEALFDAIAHAAAPRLIRDFNAQELASIAWAFARAADGGGALAEPLAAAARARASEFDAQQLATLAMALAGAPAAGKAAASAGRRAAKALARAARASMATFGALDLDTLASAYARMGLERWGAKLTRAICGAGARLLRANSAEPLSPRHLTGVLSAVARLATRSCLGRGRAPVREPAIASFAATAGRSLAERARECSPRDLANGAWALLTLGAVDRAAMEALALAAAARLCDFNAQETSKLLYAMERASIRCAELAAAASATRELRLDLGVVGGPLVLRHVLGGGRAENATREATGATGSTGSALWEGSVALAEWLARHESPAAVDASLPSGVRGRTALASCGDSWCGVSVVEVGAGLGLPAIVAHRLGARNVVATDGDDVVLRLLAANARLNALDVAAAPLRVAKLEWGADEPLASLGLGSGGGAVSPLPHVILASDVVYGRDPTVWRALARTLASLSDAKTLVLLGHGNGAAPGVAELRGPFYRELERAGFACARIAQRQLHVDHLSCQLHCLVRKQRSSE